MLSGTWRWAASHGPGVDSRSTPGDGDRRRSGSARRFVRAAPGPDQGPMAVCPIRSSARSEASSARTGALSLEARTPDARGGASSRLSPAPRRRAGHSGTSPHAARGRVPARRGRRSPSRSDGRTVDTSQLYTYGGGYHDPSPTGRGRAAAVRRRAADLPPSWLTAPDPNRTSRSRGERPSART